MEAPVEEERPRPPQPMPPPSPAFVVVLAGCLFGISLAILVSFTEEVPEVYMDEFFHERQTRLYVQGRFDVWDEKITTFPGLYFAATGWIKLLDLLSSLWTATTGDEIPSDGPAFLLKLRLMNSVFNVASFILLYNIYRHKKLNPFSAAAHALSLMLYPIVFFFGFLYYTDAGSLLLVLGMYYLAHLHQHLAAAVVGSMSIMFRQTNAVWVAYVLGTAIVRDLAVAREKRGKGEWPRWADADPHDPLSVGLLLRFVGYLLHSCRRLLWLFWPYLVPLGAFAAFVVANGGSIVVGDRSHHQMTVHVAQLAYFFALAGAFHSPTDLLASLPQALDWLRRLGPLVVLVGGGALAWLLDRYTLSHPFLLADNRHYTFYLWQRFFQRVPHANVWLLPGYVLCGWWVLSRLSSSTSPLTSLILVVALALTLLPAHLLEPRYFTTGLLLASLDMPNPRPALSLLLTLVASVAINALTIHIFLSRPFTWNDGSTARFMW